MRQAVAEFAAFVNGARRFRRAVRADAARKNSSPGVRGVFFLVASTRWSPARRAGASGAARVYPWQELTASEAGHPLELAKQAAMRVLWHGRCRVSRGMRKCPGLMEGTQVEVDIGGEIKTEGLACDEEVRHRINTSTLTQQMTQMEQGSAQGCPAMQRVTFWPEQLGEDFAQMDAAFHR